MAKGQQTEKQEVPVQTPQDTSAASANRGTNSRTLKGLNNLQKLTNVIHSQNVPGVAQPRPENDQSLFQVREVSIEDILDSDYQTRETVNPERFQRLMKSMKEEGPKEYKDAIPVRTHPTIPGKWQVARGGHTRLKAAQQVGLKHYPIIIVDYDNKRSALATGRENLARADELSPVEEGRYYLLMKEFGYTQVSLAEELGISRDRIKECEAAAQSPEHVLEMFARIKELGGDTNRGLRAAKYFRRLTVLDERQAGLAARLSTPLIDAFLYERITTDGLDIATKHILQADDPEAVVASIIRDLHRKDEQAEHSEVKEQNQSPNVQKDVRVPEIQRSEKLTLTVRRFQQFTTLIGQQPPSHEERRVLENMRQEIDTLLNR
jgi:ParB/RepB/Spo0J family partition protein